MHVPLGYTWSYLAAGWPNEFLARLFTALPALGCLGAVWALARTLGNRMTAALAALLGLACAPMFGNWASSGYVDLPAAFYTLLALLCVWRLWQRGRLQDALLAGLLWRPGRLDQKRRPDSVASCWRCGCSWRCCVVGQDGSTWRWLWSLLHWWPGPGICAT